MISPRPRVVLVTRETELSALLTRHGTRGQVEFYLSSRGQPIEEVDACDLMQRDAVAAVKAEIPAEWSLAEVERGDLNRFLFSPDDIVVALGQDGLVANLAKYLAGQPVLGVTPSADMGEGILTRYRLGQVPDLLRRAGAQDVEAEARAMVEAQIAGGDSLLALNELFIGHRSHQSARYDLRFAGETEFQSSSGMIVSTGTGLSGWGRSIMAATQIAFSFSAEEPKAAFFAREPWPSRSSGDRLRAGVIDDVAPLSVVSRMGEGGVVFADGIEQDFLPFDWGAQVDVGIAPARLRLVIG